MRLVEIFEAIPTLFLLLTFVAFFGRSLYLMMLIIGLTSWSGYARYVRAEFLRLRQQDFVQGAIASGLSLPSILFRHMLPNGMAPILVAASFGVASAILAEATLSFLGLGLVDDPSWGQMLNQAVQSSTFNWWMAAFPGGAIFLTVFAYNLIGEALRDAVDPHVQSGKAKIPTKGAG
jgi:peptide/nickel transport system permease protein